MCLFLFYLGTGAKFLFIRCPTGNTTKCACQSHLYIPSPPTRTPPSIIATFAMFEQHISSDILLHHHDEKLISRNLYLCQPHTVIQLIEVASPPPRRISSVINSSSAASSSYTSSSSSSFEENQEEEEDEDEEMEDEEEEEEELEQESYCSSDDDDIDVRLSPRAAAYPDTLSGRMKRILLWREQSPQLLSGLWHSGLFVFIFN